MALAADAGRDSSIYGLLKSPDDKESLRFILEWCEICPGLLKTMVSVIQSQGVSETTRLLRMSSDLFDCPSFDSAAVRRLGAYEVAERFWNECDSFSKDLCLAFAPFLGFLPRCHEDYCREYELRREKKLHKLRDWVFKWAPQAQVDAFWATFNQSRALVTNETVKVLIFFLKQAGLIRKESMLGPASIDGNTDLPHDLLEGTAMYSIHPVFTVFLRHKASRAGLGLLSPSKPEAALLASHFIEYHDCRVFEWFDQTVKGLPMWDRYTESLHGRHSFLAAMELTLSFPELTIEEDFPMPRFLHWNMITANGSQGFKTKFTVDSLMTYAKRAWPRALEKLSEVYKGFRLRQKSALMTAATLTICIQFCIFLSTHSLEANNDTEFQLYLSQGQSLIVDLPIPLQTALALSPANELQAFLDIFEKLRLIGNGDDLCRSLTISQLLPDPIEKSQILTEGWNTVGESVSIAQEVILLFAREDAFTYWNASEMEAQIEDLNTKMDDLFTTLASFWVPFISSLDNEMLREFRTSAFPEAEQLAKERVEAGDRPDADTEESLMDLHDYHLISMPNYASMAIRAAQHWEPMDEVAKEFEDEFRGWRELHGRNSTLKGLEIMLQVGNEVTRMSAEANQVLLYAQLNDWDLLYEHLDLLALKVRNTSLESLDEKQFGHRIWWHNVKGLSALRLGRWKDAYLHLKEALLTARNRPNLRRRIQFATFRALIILYSTIPDEAVLSESLPYWEIIVRALILGYSATSESISAYARNGVLLTLLLVKAGEASKKNTGRMAFVPDDIAHAVVEQATRSQPSMSAEAFIESVKHLRHYSRSARSTLFFNTLRTALCDESLDSRTAMKEAEIHLFTHSDSSRCLCRFDRGETPTNPMPDSFATLPPLDLQLPAFTHLDSWTYIPRMAGIAVLMQVWQNNKLRHRGEVLTEADELSYLAQWHEAARD